MKKEYLLGGVVIVTISALFFVVHMDKQAIPAPAELDDPVQEAYVPPEKFVALNSYVNALYAAGSLEDNVYDRLYSLLSQTERRYLDEDSSALPYMEKFIGLTEQFQKEEQLLSSDSQELIRRAEELIVNF